VAKFIVNSYIQYGTDRFKAKSFSCDNRSLKGNWSDVGPKGHQRAVNDP